jgi:hypothetical protein
MNDHFIDCLFDRMVIEQMVIQPKSNLTEKVHSAGRSFDRHFSIKISGLCDIVLFEVLGLLYNFKNNLSKFVGFLVT